MPESLSKDLSCRPEETLIQENRNLVFKDDGRCKPRPKDLDCQPEEKLVQVIRMSIFKDDGRCRPGSREKPDIGRKRSMRKL